MRKRLWWSMIGMVVDWCCGFDISKLNINKTRCCSSGLEIDLCIILEFKQKTLIGRDSSLPITSRGGTLYVKSKYFAYKLHAHVVDWTILWNYLA